jgi:hypothetical protein
MTYTSVNRLTMNKKDSHLDRQQGQKQQQRREHNHECKQTAVKSATERSDRKKMDTSNSRNVRNSILVDASNGKDASPSR